ncbi:glycosyl hydrolase [Pedobacter psychrodurus]|uniref:glycosyl hydrolase n=1 Tax=Pedobacter psychrodurus TaxID=2530456 RepID=UPI00292DBA93|nr:glycosyl hydrolase [Pedobacter psychrodurus]
MKNIFKKTGLFLLGTAILSGSFCLSAHAQIGKMKTGFVNPKDSYKPGVYWYFMDGNLSAGSITKDLEAMKKAGIGNLVFLEVNVGIPRGKVDFLSPQWVSLFTHAEKEARRLGIEITLGIGPGWTGSGGPWVKAEESMQHLVSSEITVSSADKGKIVLPLPMPKRPFFGEGNLSAEVRKQWMAYYKDVAVLAFPYKEQTTKITDVDEKALYYRAPYSSGTVKPYLSAPLAGEGGKAKGIEKSAILDLTSKMSADGSLNWTPPSGKWIVMRFGARNNGAITRPAPIPGLGFESDKFDTLALNHHLDTYVGRLLSAIGKPQKNIPGGLKRLHMDSWEMGAQNWTGSFRQAFIKSRGYDPLKYFPAYSGNIVGSLQESERFLWDLRETAQELILKNHAEQVKAYAHRHGLSLSIEPYDMNPTADLRLGAVADVPMAEFWSKGFGFNSTYSVIEATSIGHVMGRSLIPAEAFTAQDNEGWKQHPTSMKNQGDWAFAAGVNRFVYHTFQNQFLPDSLRPGATMGPYGVHWDRNQTWWPMVDAYHQYVSRCQYLLQQGRTVADILYLTPEGSPHVFVPPSTALRGDTLADRKGYNFDGCAPAQLMKAYVENQYIVFPGGARYRILVLPESETITPELLTKINALISSGATVIGNPPKRSPSLVGYPVCDEQVKQMAGKIWGAGTLPKTQEIRNYGKGKIIWGEALLKPSDHLYPQYDLTARLLHQLSLDEDFSTTAPVRYTHRTGKDWDIYFVSNSTNAEINFKATFRTVKGSPQLWDAITGKSRRVPEFSVTKGKTLIPLELAPYQSCFIVFAKENQHQPLAGLHETKRMELLSLNEAWEVNFDPKWGGPKTAVFDSLSDWSKNKVEGIKYYSGIAAYHKTFDFKETHSKEEIYLDLGKVKNMARVTLNGKAVGVLWAAPWRIDISPFIKQGKNELTIEIANLWPNRLIGDEKKPDDGIVGDQWPQWLLNGQPRTSGRFTFTSTKQYNADSPLFESGLLGPVKIIGQTLIIKQTAPKK